ncbi:cell division protein ZipA C-terminal FtsZ-binding domain-containing protein [Chitinimonas koreensis]|uniref:cell division protein ZipA C-terminal FtsZ-binding domain-containing protein n=1 Tax=Chitinimonas koreensis TaxID=356302 RepID=UPI0003F89C8C|nr:cell division protein ZipA C-terminal FtsZ-binding domain-containing protein [Chitinimonas koreensis]QNM98485.1 cell division protein ZipA C-terminal FtsZ-binding domain-containing protein [Chitinimonas koreensis]
MSEFHWITLGLGAALVGAVWGFNAWQEWRFKKRAAAAFARSHPDVLLDTPKNMVRQGETGMRLEPTLEPAATVLGEPLAPVPEMVDLADSVALAVAILDPALDYVAEVHPGDLVDYAAVPSIEVGKRVRVLGLSDADEWEVIRPGHRYQEFRIGLQLVDRQGPVSEAQLVMFCEQVNAFADAQGGVATFPRREDKLRVAQQLDGFCAEVDMLIGLNVVSSRNPFALSRVVAMAEAAGLVLETDGVFHARSDSGKPLFTLADRHHRPLDALDDTPSVTLLLDVPRVAGGEQAFDRMADLAQQMALTLGGDLVDDDNRSLKPADLAAIRKQLVSIYAKMDDRGIPGGGVAALRLFA